MEDNKLNFFSFSNIRENVPQFSESGRKDWINYGDNNNYPKYLVELLDKSSKHNAVVKRKTDLSVSGGWIPNELNKDFIANENSNEDLNDIAYKSGYDLNLYGAFALIITWAKDRQSIARIKYIDLAKVRIAKDIEESDDADRYERQESGVEFYYISQDWDNTRKVKNKPQLFQGFSKEFNDVATQILYVKEYRPGVEYYTLPDYISSIDWIALDMEIANFHLNSVQNGFTPSMIISFNQGIPTQEEQQRIYKQVQARYSGTDNASKVFITFSDGGEKKPEFTPVDLNDSDERFLMLEEHIMSNVMIGHRIPPLIAGIMVEGKLGSSTEVEEQEKMFQSQVISAKQKLVERAYNKLYNIGIPNDSLKLELVTTFNQSNKNNE